MDLAATETARADPNAFWLTADQCPNWLEVGLKYPLGLVISVTDVMAGLATFTTEIACKCHGALLYLVESLQDCNGQKLPQAIRLDKQV